MWAPICQVGKWQGMFGEVEITHEKIDSWVNAFGPDEKIPVTLGHLADADNPIHTGEPAPCWISGLMKAGDLCLGNFVDWTSAGLEAITSGGYKNVSIESKDGSRLTSVALLSARTPGVEFHGSRGRFVPLDMAGECLGEVGKILLAAALGGEPIALPYKTPPDKVTKFFKDTEGPDAWMKAFNNAYKQYDGDEAKANATAWAQIEKMGYEKGKDGIYRKSKKAAEAATQGGRMSFKEKVLAALKDVTARLEGEPEEAAVLTELAPFNTVALAGESVDMKALAARVDELDKQVKSQAVELQMAGAKAEAAELCRTAHLAPKFIEPLGEYLAGKSVIMCAEPDRDKDGKVIKEYKVSRNEFFMALLAAKGTAKLDDPKILAEPPAKREVTPFVIENPGQVSEARKTEIAREAQTEALAAGKGDDAAYISNLMISKMNAEVKKWL